MMRLFVTTIESIKTPTGQDGFRIILSDGSELAGVRDVTVNATESGVMTAYFAVGGEFKVVTGLASMPEKIPDCEHDWICTGTDNNIRHRWNNYICCKCDEQKREPVRECDHEWCAVLSLPRLGGSFVMRCVQCGKYK